MSTQSPIHVKSFKLRPQLIEINLIKKYFRFQQICYKKNRIPLFINTKILKVPIQAIKGLQARSVPYKLKVSLKKLPKGFYTPSPPKTNKIAPKIHIQRKQGSIELFVPEGQFPNNKKIFLPAIAKKYPLLSIEDIVFYKYFPKVDVAKLSNFKFVDKKLLIRFNFSISKTKLSSLVFFIDRVNKLTRFVSIDS